MTMKMWFLDWDLSTVSSTTTLTAKLMSFTQYFKVCQGIPWYYHGTSPIHWGIKLFDSLIVHSKVILINTELFVTLDHETSQIHHLIHHLKAE